MVGALGFGDHRTIGVCARSLDREHQRFGPGVDEAELFKALVAGEQVLGVLDLDLGAHVEGGAFFDLFPHYADHVGVGMAVDERGHVVGKVDPVHSIYIDNVAAVGVIDIERVGITQDRVAADATREDFACTLEQFGAAGGLCWCTHQVESLVNRKQVSAVRRCAPAHSQSPRRGSARRV